MVYIAPLIGAVALLTSFVAAVPVPDNDFSKSSSSSYGGDNSQSYGGSSDNSNSYGGSSDNSNSYSGSSDNSNSYGGSNDNSNSYGGSSNSYGGSSNSYGGSSDNSNSYGGSSNNYGGDSYSGSKYGSGMSNWGGSGYDDCVNQCMASYGNAPATYQATATSGSSGSKGNGATHTVIVAPTKGVFRYVPFAVNASVGDTIMFKWGADNHTVTSSSALLPCNKSDAAPIFASGEQNSNFVFTQVVNSTEPTFYHCATPGHCQKGMFGIINPPNAFASLTSVNVAMGDLISNNSDLSAMAAYTSTQVGDNTAAGNWGGSIDMASMPGWSHELVVANTLYTRSFLAANSEVMKADGSVDLSTAPDGKFLVPDDISAPLQAANAVAAAAVNNAAAASASGSVSASASAPSASASSGKSNGAGAVAPSVIFAGVAIAATFFAL